MNAMGALVEHRAVIWNHSTRPTSLMVFVRMLDSLYFNTN